jgi:hypothetical protein
MYAQIKKFSSSYVTYIYCIRSRRCLTCQRRFLLVNTISHGVGVWVAWGKGWTNGLWETGQLTFNMGPEWSKVCTLHWRPPPQVRDFSHLRTPHENTIRCIRLNIYVFLLCRLKINHMKELRHQYIFLGLFGWLWTI